MIHCFTTWIKRGQYSLSAPLAQAPHQPTSRSCYLFFQPSLESSSPTLASSTLAEAGHSCRALFPRSSTSIHPLSLSSQDCPSTLSKLQECTHIFFTSLNLKISLSTGQNPDLLSEMHTQSHPFKKKKKGCHDLPKILSPVLSPQQHIPPTPTYTPGPLKCPTWMFLLSSYTSFCLKPDFPTALKMLHVL